MKTSNQFSRYHLSELKNFSNIRILDPACGSGSFLLGAYKYLLEYHLNHYAKSKNPKRHKDQIYKGKGGEWFLTIKEKKRILLNNLYGVDIDPQAAEVTKLGLLLKVLEGENKDVFEQQQKLFQERALPDLGNNIKCGNSLIGPEFYSSVQLTLDQTQTVRRVNIFDWNDQASGFGEIIENGGFDAIIGNPPYIQIQKLKEFYPEETEFYQNNYETAKEKNVDIYIPFIEKALSLLTKGGLLGFICPNRFFNSDYGEKLRNHLKNFNLYQLVNFRHYFIFNRADTYTCLLFLQNKKQQNKLIYKEFRDLYKNESDKIDYLLNNAKEPEQHFEIDKIEPRFVEQDKWYFMTEGENKIFEKIIKFPKFNTFYKEFFVGVQTSLDKVYILKYLGENKKEYHLYSRYLDEEVVLEKKIVKPIIDNNNIDSYYIVPSKECVIFPYKIENGKATLLSPKELRSPYPKTWDYLLKNKKALEDREKGRMKGDDWYAYIYPKNLAKQNLKKILIPHVVKTTVAAMDNEGDFCLDNVGANGIILKDEVKEHPNYFIAILNSPISSFFISRTSIFLSGGFYATNKQFAGEIPIRKIDFKNLEEKKKHDAIVGLVTNLFDFKKKLNKSNLKHDKDLFSRQIDAIETQIYKSVYELYGIKENEKKIIERT